MTLTAAQMFIMIAAIASATIITRFMPFIMFPENRKLPKIVKYLSSVLPPAMMGLLVVYCLKDIEKTKLRGGFGIYGLKEIVSVAVIIILHKWKSNVFLSIGAGTFCYMLLTQLL